MRFLKPLLLLVIILQAAVSLAAPNYCTITGVVLKGNGDPCVSCNVTFRVPYTQQIGGTTINAGIAESFALSPTGVVPPGTQLAQTLVAEITIDYGPPVQLQIPSTSTADLSTMVTPPVNLPTGTSINQLTDYPLMIAGGGTNATSFTPDACVQVAHDGNSFISAAASCGTGSGGGLTSVYDITKYGALGTGVDDAPAIQAAIDAAGAAGGGTVWVPEGTYWTGATLNMNVAGVSLECANPSTSTIKLMNGLNIDMLRIGFTGSRVLSNTVKNCGFNGNNGNNLTSGGVIYLRDAAYAVLQGNLIQFYRSFGVKIDATISTIIQNYTIDNIVYGGFGPAYIQANGGSNPTDNFVSRNVFGGSDSFADTTQPVVNLTSLSGLSFTDNHVYGSPLSHSDCIKVAQPSAVIDAQANFTGNTIESCRQNGIQLDTTANVQIQNNKFYWIGRATGNDNQYDAINVTNSGAGAYSLVITGNKLHSASSAGTGETRDLLHSTSANNGLFADNYARNNFGYTINTTSGSNNFIRDNHFAGSNGLGAYSPTTVSADLLTGANFANQGTTTQLLHGNAAGNLSWGAVDLSTAQVTNVLPNTATTATNANTPSTIVARDSSGNFSAGTITAALAGNAATATTAVNATSATTATTAINNTLLNGRSGTGNDTILTTSVGPGVAGTLYGANATGNNLNLRANSADVTSGSINLDAPTVNVWPSEPGTLSNHAFLINATPTATITGGVTSGWTLLNATPTFSVADALGMAVFSVGGSINRTGTTGGAFYAFDGFYINTALTSSSAGGPLFQDSFYDNVTVSQEANTASQLSFQPISFLSKPTLQAKSGATLTIGQTTGLDLNPTWGLSGGGSLTNNTYSGVKVHAPNNQGGTLSLPTYIGADFEDLKIAAVTDAISLRSVGLTTSMRHAGPARFGATGAPTATKALDVQGDALVTGYLDYGSTLPTLSSGMTSGAVYQPTGTNVSGTGMLNAIRVSPTITLTGNGIGTPNPFLMGFDFEPTVSWAGANFTVPTIHGIHIGGSYSNNGANNASPQFYGVHQQGTFDSSTAGRGPMGTANALVNNNVFSYSATSGSVSVPGIFEAGFLDNPTVKTTGLGGASWTTGDIYTVKSQLTGSSTAGTTLTIPNRYGVAVNEVALSGAGTNAFTNQFGVWLDALAAATNNYGIYSTIAAATGRWFLYDTGGANSALRGNLRIADGTATPVAPIAALDVTGKFSVDNTGIVKRYNNVNTAGFGLAPIYSDAAISATKTANFTVQTLAPSAFVGRFLVSAVITTTSAAQGGTLQCVIEHTDSQGISHTTAGSNATVMPISAQGVVGATVAAAAVSTNYPCLPTEITINNAGANIVLKVVTTGTVAYTVAGTIQQLGVN